MPAEVHHEAHSSCGSCCVCVCAVGFEREARLRKMSKGPELCAQFAVFRIGLLRVPARGPDSQPATASAGHRLSKQVLVAHQVLAQSREWLEGQYPAAGSLI